MAKIKSNVELIFDARSQRQGIIIVEISDWRYKSEENRYIAQIQDYVLQTVDGVEQKIMIHQKQLVYTKEQIDGLFYLLQNPIELTESYSSEMDMLISQALLYVTQQDPIYGSLANNWEIF